MEYRKTEMFYEGKAKRLYKVEGHPEYVIQEFKDSLTAFNGEKKGSFTEKGALNRDISSLVFRFLSSRGVKHHWITDQGENLMVNQKLTIIPLEVVVRNRAAGSLAKKFGWEEGRELPFPLVELYFKDDKLGDPLVNDEHALMLQACNALELAQLKESALAINQHLKEFYAAVGLDLIDFKLEFGRDAKGEIVLADEISPDSSRLWDSVTKEKMDKDRFRRDLGRVQETYEEVYRRLSTHWEGLL